MAGVHAVPWPDAVQTHLSTFNTEPYSQTSNNINLYAVHLGGNAADIQARATERPSLLNAHLDKACRQPMHQAMYNIKQTYRLEAELGSLDGSHIASRTTADDAHVILATSSGHEAHRSGTHSLRSGALTTRANAHERAWAATHDRRAFAARYRWPEACQRTSERLRLRLRPMRMRAGNATPGHCRSGEIRQTMPLQRNHRHWQLARCCNAPCNARARTRSSFPLGGNDAGRHPKSVTAPPAPRGIDRQGQLQYPSTG